MSKQIMEDKAVVTVPVKGSVRVEALDILVSRDHSSRSGVMNKALDLLIEQEGVLETINCGSAV